ncbi:MAG: hypothetical protein JRI36_09900 [Deltaproteobacteria bacterium]|nr:hypothetical protein [Deltaproteobacteria bacterium]
MNGPCAENEDRVSRVLKRIEQAIDALEGCDGKLTPEGYKAVRQRVGHLMDTLYRVGDALSKAT